MNQAKLLKELTDYCEGSVNFKPGDSYYWSPKDKTVFYQEDDPAEVGLWTLLHEACHGLLGHKTYHTDFELVLLEVQAWNKAEELAKYFDISIDEDHLQDCLDSYRDWQYRRSICPRCELGGVQLNTKKYRCLFCDNHWAVSESRFCRPYRRKID